jgi:hypothetical protein
MRLRGPTASAHPSACPAGREPMTGGARPRRRLIGSRDAVLVAIGVTVAAGFALFLGSAFVMPDSVIGLIWGRELAHWELGSFAPGPTPHPFPILSAAVTSLLGTDGSYVATYLLFGPVALGALVAAVFAVGREIRSAAAGAAAALVLLTSEPVLGWSSWGSYDVAFAALLMAALARELAAPRQGMGPLVLLAVAGLIRPEAWVVAGAYWLWLLPRRPPREAVRLAAPVAIAPLAWMAMDMAVMGDPLYSLHVTESASEGLYGGFSWVENLIQGGSDLLWCVGVVPLLAAARAIFTHGHGGRPAMTPVLALLAITLGLFVVLIVSGMPSNERYLLVPTCLIAVLAGVGATAWRSLPAPVVLAALALLLVEMGLIRGDALLDVRDGRRPAVERHRQAQQLIGRAEVRRVLSECPTVALPWRIAPVWAYLSGRAFDDLSFDEQGRSRPDVFVAPANREAARALLTRPRFDADASFTVPTSLLRGPRTRDWLIHVDDDAPCVEASGAAAAA